MYLSIVDRAFWKFVFNCFWMKKVTNKYISLNFSIDKCGEFSYNILYVVIFIVIITIYEIYLARKVQKGR